VTAESSRDGPRWVGTITWRASVVLVGVALIVWVALGLRDLILQTFIALIVACALLAPVSWLERRVRRGFAIAIAVLGLVAGVVLILILVIPPLASQFVAFVAALPDMVANLMVSVEELLDSLLGPGQGAAIVESWTSGGEVEVPDLGAIIGTAVGVGGALFNAGFWLITTLIFIALMLAERDRAKAWVANFWPPDERPWALNILGEATQKLGAYVRGLLLVMTYEGVGVAIGAAVLGMPYAVVLGAVTFLAAAVPYLGTLIMVVPAFIVGLTVSPFAAIAIVVWIIILEQVEGLVVTPLVQSHAVEVSPLAVMIGVLAGFTLFGFVGGIIAVPLVALLDLLLTEIIFPIRQGRLDEVIAAGGADAAALPGAEAAAQMPRAEAQP
jgi:predicted PurR-regulated permease PerM